MMNNNKAIHGGHRQHGDDHDDDDGGHNNHDNRPEHKERKYSYSRQSTYRRHGPALFFACLSCCWIIFALLSSSSVGATTTIDQREQQQENTMECHANEDEEIICQFRIPSPKNKNKSKDNNDETNDDYSSSSSSSIRHAFQSCHVDGYDDGFCINAAIDVVENMQKENENTEKRQQLDGGDSEKEVDSDNRDNSNVDNTYHDQRHLHHHHHNHHDQEQQQQSTSSSSSSSAPSMLSIGDATYRPPYEQNYKYEIALILQRVPVSIKEHDNYNNNNNNYQSNYYSKKMSIIEQVNWYYDLALAHYENGITLDVGYSSNQHALEEEMMLTINALQQIIQILNGDSTSTTSSSSNDEKITKDDVVSMQERDEYLASVYFTMGEAYLTIPDYRFIQESVDSYTKSESLYENMILLSSSSKTIYDDGTYHKFSLEKGHADACTKLGIALITAMGDPMSGISSEAVGHGMDGDGTASTTADLLNLVMMTMNQHQEQGHSDQGGLGTIQTAIHMLDKAIHFYQKYLMIDDDMTKEGDNNGGDGDVRSSSTETGKTDGEQQKQREQRLFYDRYIVTDSTLLIELETGYAVALHHTASTFVLAGQATKAIGYFEQSIRMQVHSLLPKLSIGSAEYYATQMSLADLYLNLADAALQSGKYRLAKDGYQKAMEWYETYNIEVAPMHTLDPSVDGDETLQQTIQLLKEYRLSVNHGKPISQSSSSSSSSHGAGRLTGNEGINGAGYGEYYIDRDDGYEGDLLSSIGSLYLSYGNPQQALSYLEQAVSKYVSKGEDMTHPMADLKFNLAMVYYRLRQFNDSTRTYVEALDIYRQLYGDDVNPLVQGMEEIQQQVLELQKQQQHLDGFGGSFDFNFGTSSSSSQQKFSKTKTTTTTTIITEMTDDDDDDDDSDSDTSLDGENNKYNEGGLDTVGTGTKATTTGDNDGSGGKGRVIDLELYKQSIQNDTTSTTTTMQENAVPKHGEL